MTPSWPLRALNVRVVADTNTVVSAVFWGGLPAQVLAAARDARIQLYASAPLLAELEGVLSRDRFVARIERAGSSGQRVLAGYRALATPVRPAGWHLRRGTPTTITPSPVRLGRWPAGSSRVIAT